MLDGVGAHVRVVLDDQDGLARSSCAAQRACHLRHGERAVVGRQAGQVELHRRAVAHFAVDLDVAARLLHEAVDLRQPEAGALADVLGREERLEGAGEDVAASCPSRCR